MSLGNLDPTLVANLGGPTRLIAAPSRFPDPRVSNSRLSGLGGVHTSRRRCGRTALGPGAGQQPAANLKWCSHRASCAPGAHRTSGQAELVVSGGCQVLLSSWERHQSPSPYFSSIVPWQEWPWSPDPTPTRLWWQPDLLGWSRRALRARLPILTLHTQHPAHEEKEGLRLGQTSPPDCVQFRLCALLSSFAEAGVENQSPSSCFQ